MILLDKWTGWPCEVRVNVLAQLPGGPLHEALTQLDRTHVLAAWMLASRR
jgi:hypothetical protein